MMGLRSFQKILDMTKFINSRFELSEILQVLVDAIAGEIASADLVGFFIRQTNGKFYGHTGNNPEIDIKKLIIDPDKDEFVRDILITQDCGYIPDTTRDKRPDPEKVELMKIHSILGIPIIINNEPFGLVFLHDFGKPMNLTDEQIEVTIAFVNMASVAIRNIQMFEHTQVLLQRQQLLLDVTNALSKSLSIEDVLKTCFHYMEQTTGSQDIGAHLYDENARVVKPFHLSTTGQYTEEEWKGKHSREIRINIDNDRLFYEVITNKKAIAISDVFADPRPNHAACRTFNIHSLMLIPLVAKGQVFGTVAVPSIHKQKTYSQGEIEFCQSIADVTAAALSNAIYAESLDSSVKERTAELRQANFKLEELVKELQHLNELKNDFIASLSHELRTPITAIKGSNDILLRGILGQLNSAQIELLETSNKAGERLLNQVNELLDFAKLENGKFELNYDECYFDNIVSEAIRIIEPLVEKKRQNLVVQSNAPVHLNVDRQRILQILLNLLSNANKFTPENGSITVNSLIRDGNLVVEVHDNGAGIPLDKQKNLFTKFYQVNNRLNGTGLGLAISKQLTELHGGQIDFVSAEGKGSVFKIMLPIKE